VLIEAPVVPLKKTKTEKAHGEYIWEIPAPKKSSTSAI
jgi:hypothetical protein